MHSLPDGVDCAWCTVQMGSPTTYQSSLPGSLFATVVSILANCIAEVDKGCGSCLQVDSMASRVYTGRFSRSGDVYVGASLLRTLGGIAAARSAL